MTALSRAPVLAGPVASTGPVRGRLPPARSLSAALVAGLALCWSFPPHGSGWVVVASVALLLAAVRGLSVRAGLLAGLVFGLAFFLPLLRWSGVFVGAFPWLLLSVACAVIIAPLGALLVLARRAPAWPLAAAGCWVAVEAMRDRVPFGGFPWGDLAFGSPGSPWAGFAVWGGGPLVAFTIVTTAGLVVLALERLVTGTGGRRLSVVALAVAVALTGLGAFAPHLPDGTHSDGASTVAAVQGNVPRTGLGDADQALQVTLNHLAATEQLARDVAAGTVAAPQLVLWPENSTDVDPFRNPAVAALLDRAARAAGVPVLVGAVLDGPGRYIRNAGVVWTPGAAQRGEAATPLYVKQHPVPFAEYIPLRSLARRVSSKVDLVPRDFAAGHRTGVLDVAGLRLGDVICFEVAYGGIVRAEVDAGAQLLVVQTNNATFGNSGESEQQVAMGRLRAIETGRAVVLISTTGISAMVRPDGTVSAATDVFTRKVLVARLPLVDGRTPAVRLGVWPEALLAGLGLALTGVGIVGRRRRRDAWMYRMDR